MEENKETVFFTKHQKISTNNVKMSTAPRQQKSYLLSYMHIKNTRSNWDYYLYEAD